jgi:hypothetical protein
VFHGHVFVVAAEFISGVLLPVSRFNYPGKQVIKALRVPMLLVVALVSVVSIATINRLKVSKLLIP